MDEPYLTDRAQRVLQRAEQEARRLAHPCVATEHLLLGVAREGGGVAAQALKERGAGPPQLRQVIARTVQYQGYIPQPGELPRLREADEAIELAGDLAHHLRQGGAEPEHLLLGLLREQSDGGDVAVAVLQGLGVGPDELREGLLGSLGWGPTACAVARAFPESAAHDLPAETRRAVQSLDAEIERLQQDKEAAVAAQDFQQAALLRDEQIERFRERKALIRGWRARYEIDPSWLRWNGGEAARLARAIHDAANWEALPVLADALEEAGCTDTEVLSHLRQSGGHVWGCWVVDLLMRKL